MAFKENNMNLYEISNEYNDALHELSGMDLDEDTIENSLAILKGNLETKAKNVAAFIENRAAEINAVKEASKKLATRAANEQKALDRLKEYLKFNMEQSGITEIRSPELVLKIKKNPVSVVIDDPAGIPVIFIASKTVETINKKSIKAAIEEGHSVPGAHLEQKSRLDIS